MLFGVIYKPRPGVPEQSENRALQLFTNWQPPEGFEFRAHYFRADGNGGFLVAEVDSAEAIAEAIAPYTPFFEYEVSPVLDAEAGVPILQRTTEWRDSVG